MRSIGIAITTGLVLAGGGLAHGDEPLRDAASAALECRGLSDDQTRLACLDAALGKLEAAMTPTWAQAPEPREAPAPQAPPQTAAVDGAGGTSPVAAPPAPPAPKEQVRDRDGGFISLPTWARAPFRDDPEEVAKEPREFEAKLVSVRFSGIGKHTFYLDNGQVWVQTQNDEVKLPKDLPANATIKKRLTGNPVIKFDNSNRTYKVRRVK